MLIDRRALAFSSDPLDFYMLSIPHSKLATLIHNLEQLRTLIYSASLIFITL